jgi:hypothetical protein
MLSACTEIIILRVSYSQHEVLRLSLHAESMILSVHAENMMIKYACHLVMFIMLIAMVMKKITIGNCQYCQFTTLVNSTSTVPLIVLPPNGAKFCHTLNILLVGRWRRRALSWLCFISSAVVGPCSLVNRPQ